jgi:hypothetical protein
MEDKMIGQLLTSYLNRRRRQRDIAMLWPSLKTVSPSIDFARYYLTWHCSLDPAWSDVSREEIIDITDRLT